MTRFRNESTTARHQSDQGDYARDDKLDAALQCIREIILEGLQHGFFHCEISAEIGKNRHRDLIVKSGKSFKFNIPLKDLNH